MPKIFGVHNPRWSLFQAPRWRRLDLNPKQIEGSFLYNNCGNNRPFSECWPQLAGTGLLPCLIPFHSWTSLRIKEYYYPPIWRTWILERLHSSPQVKNFRPHSPRPHDFLLGLPRIPLAKDQRQITWAFVKLWRPPELSPRQEET